MRRVAVVLVTLLASSAVVGVGTAGATEAPSKAPSSTATAGTTSTVARGFVNQPSAITSGPDHALWFINADDTIGRIGTDGAISAFGGPGIDSPFAITSGADGALWFTNSGNDSIGRITTSGVVTSYADPGIHGPLGIAAGHDGNVWFTNASSNSIGRITPSGVVTTFTGAGISNPSGIAAAPDGDLWFTNRSNASIGRITPSGVVSNYTDASISDPYSITAAVDGTMVFIDRGNYAVGRITPAGVVSTLAANVAFSGMGITSGPDGNVWLTTSVDTVVRVTLAGTATTFNEGMHYPSGIVAGPDGNLWFANAGTSSIGRISVTGVEKNFVRIRNPGAITAGPDGNFWFFNDSLDYDRGSIGRVTPGGAVSVFTSKEVGRRGTLAAGPDGNVWFTTNEENSVGRISPDGTVKLFHDSSIRFPTGITAGPDGNLWFTNKASIGRITPAGVVSKFTDPDIIRPMRIAAGSDGSLWFTNYQGNSIGRITTAGDIVMFAGADIDEPWGITSGPDGALWFVNSGNNSIGRITTSGSTSSYTSGTVRGQGEIASGPDGALWFTNPDTSSIGRITTAGVISDFASADIDHPNGIVPGPDGTMWFTNRNSSIGQIIATGTPSPPTAVGATPGNAQAVVTWSAPAASGAPITGYTVTASPGGHTCTWTTGPLTCTVAGLTNGQAYTFSVTATNIGGTSDPSAPSSAVVPFTVPDAPAAPTTAAGNVMGTVKVMWSPPTSNGGSAVTGYVVTASPGGITKTVTGSPLQFDGLLDGTAYTFTVQARNAAGLSAPSGPSEPALPIGVGGRFHPLSPIRLLDSREASGGFTPWGPGEFRVLQITGRAGVPANATAVALNVTVTEPSESSHLTLWSAGAARPVVSNLNFARGQTVANLTVTRLGDLGRVSIFNNAGTVHVLADIVGYFDVDSPGGAAYNPVSSTRVLDSRDGTGGLATPWGPNETRSLPMRGVGPVPLGATAAVLNVTATGATGSSHLTVFPSGQPAPLASSLNFVAGETRANLVIVKLDADGRVAIRNNAGSVNVIVDLVGFYWGAGPGDLFHPLKTARMLDSRDGTGGFTTPWGPNETRSVMIRGAADVPIGAKAVILNVTATGPSKASHLTIWPSGTSPPLASSLNFAAGQTVPNLVIVELGDDGAINIRNNDGQVHVLADVSGYFL